MPSLIEEFITTLEDEQQHYEELLILSTEKATVIRDSDAELLQQITAAETAILGKNQRLENKREAIVKNIGVVLNYDPAELTITKIAEIIENQAEHDALIAVRDKLRDTLEELKQKNELNRGLIQSSLDYIEFSVNMLRGETADPYDSFSELGAPKAKFDKQG